MKITAITRFRSLFIQHLDGIWKWGISSKKKKSLISVVHGKLALTFPETVDLEVLCKIYSKFHVSVFQFYISLMKSTEITKGTYFSNLKWIMQICLAKR